MNFSEISVGRKLFFLHTFVLFFVALVFVPQTQASTVSKQAKKLAEKVVMTSESDARVDALVDFYTYYAEQGKPKAFLLLSAHWSQQDRKRNQEKTEDWIKKAAGNGSAQAILLYGSYKQEKEGAGFKEAIEEIKKLAKKGDAEAQLMLGTLHNKPTSLKAVERNSDKGMNWITKAAKQGNADAQFVLGEIYYNGRYRIPEDRSTAKMWYQKAAVQGNAMAQRALGSYFRRGLGSKNAKQAIKWLKLAAEGTQFKYGATSLAHMYEKGRNSVGKDLVEAYKWYWLAGDDTNMSYLEKEMTSTQVKEAKARAKKYFEESAERRMQRLLGTLEL